MRGRRLQTDIVFTKGVDLDLPFWQHDCQITTKESISITIMKLFADYFKAKKGPVILLKTKVYVFPQDAL